MNLICIKCEKYKFLHAVPCRAKDNIPGWDGGPQWRKANNAPEICPHSIPLGFTPESHPELAEKLKTMTQSAPKTHGAGDLLKTIIEACGFKETSGCNCNSMRIQMNNWGFWGSYKHRKEILEWLRIKAREQNIILEEATVFAAFKAAFREYWKNRKES